MDKKLSLNFLWHMHQPYYKDDLKEQILMPWVFLHAIKDYYDMLWYLQKYPKIKATFNFVPSLLLQLKEYENPNVNDKFLQTIKKEVASLDKDQKEYLLEYLFLSNKKNMINPLPRYRELFLKKDKNFSDSQFLDLEVLFLLSWCGNYLRQNSKVVKTLLNKGSNFTQKDKITLLDSLSKFIKQIIPYYKSLMQQKQIDISTTPFNHPISPLLFDMQNAKLANSQTKLPKYQRSLKDDAILQLDSAIEYYDEVFSNRPKGFWPAEGAISYEFLQELANRDILWVGTDEDILYKSGHFEKSDIYKNNFLKFKDKKIALFFRDKTLSDLIGFTYSGWDEDSAVNDFIRRLKTIHDNNLDTKCVVSVILDGENAWEHYKDNAIHFFDKLYTKLQECDWIEYRLFDEVLKDQDIASNTLLDIKSGSWINANFDIWVGHKEKNLAWDLIYKTKDDFEKVKNSLDNSTLKKIENEFLIAQSSDWFWWYGDDHHTDLALSFDGLFRAHLINIYTLMDKRVPIELHKAIIDTKTKKSFIKNPSKRVTAIIDGKITNFFEWLGCGVVDLKHELTSMNMQEFLISKIYFGSDSNYCYIALIGDIKGDKLVIEFEKNKEIELNLKNHLQEVEGIMFIADEIIELRIDRSMVENDKIGFKLFKDKTLIQLLPLYTKIEFDYIKNLKKSWFV